MVVLDEHGLQWAVKQGEPAYDAINYLLKIGFKNIVLPLAILLNGRKTDALPWPSMDEASKRAGKDFLRYCSLLDQAKALDMSGDFG